MFESTERLAEDIQALLDSIRELAGGRYAAVFEPRGLVFESAEPGGEEPWVLRHYLERRTGPLFRIPAALAEGTEIEDVFADWTRRAGEEEDEFLLAFLNGRVVLVVACRDAEGLKSRIEPPLHVLADRLLRYNSAWRVDEKGRGLFVGRPRLDLVVVGRPQ